MNISPEVRELQLRLNKLYEEYDVENDVRSFMNKMVKDISLLLDSIPNNIGIELFLMKGDENLIDEVYNSFNITFKLI